MTICVKDEYNFLHECEYDQIKVFRKRVVGLILATDMAKHMEDLKSFKSACESRGVNELADNIESFIDISHFSETIQRKSRAFLLLPSKIE